MIGAPLFCMARDWARLEITVMVIKLLWISTNLPVGLQVLITRPRIGNCNTPTEFLVPRLSYELPLDLSQSA